MSAELDVICCKFAGIEPTNSQTNSETGEAIEYYPPVSKDWAAAGRLMEALREKGVPSEIAVESRNLEWCGWCYFESRRNFTQRANSGPMALALAVAELAKGK